MLQQQYVILRHASKAEGFRTETSSERSSQVPDARIESASLQEREVLDLARDPQVGALAPVMPTSLVRPFSVSTVQDATCAWGIAAIRADRSGYSGKGTIVAVLDTGIDRAHSAFEGIPSVVEEDFTGEGNGDHAGHGTHCAGTIFGRDVEGKRIGIARGVTRVLIGKVLGGGGNGTSEMIFRAIDWAVRNGANVISMSLGFDFPGAVKRMVDAGWPTQAATSNALEAYRQNLRMFDALMGVLKARAAFDEGTLIVAAAGNESHRGESPDYTIAASLPAAAEDVVSVAALQQDAEMFRVAPFSNTFAQLSAPGVNILSARAGGGLIALSGTSMACPHVVVAAALWWESVRAAPIKASAATVTAKLLGTARTDPFAPDVGPTDRGLGIVTAP
jgi:subtilisin family serine protease